jgi:hypothetical protein
MKRPDRPANGGFRIGAECLGLRDETLCPWQQQPAQCGEGNRVAVAIEQRAADLGLERTQTLGQAGLGDVQSGGGPPEMGAFGDGDEGL